MKPTAINTLFMLGLLLLAGCTNITRNPLPYEQLDDARILGREDLRYWGDLSRNDSNKYIFTHLTEEDVKKRYASLMGQEHHYLAISGGGANGAFGAGALVGWTDKG